MTVWLGVVALLGVIAAAALLRGWVRDLRALLAVRSARPLAAGSLTDGPVRLVGRLEGRGRVDDLRGQPAVFVDTTATWITRASAPGAYQVTTMTPSEELQPGARVVALTLVGDDGARVRVAGLGRLVVDASSCELVDEEVSTSELARRFPWVAPPSYSGVTHVALEQRVLRPGARVAVGGVLRSVADRDGAHGYREDAVAWELDAGAEGVVTVGAPDVTSAGARAVLASLLLLAAVVGLLASSWEAATRAWWLR